MRTCVVAAIVLMTGGLALFLWFVSHGLLVIFASIVFAVMLDGLSRLVKRFARLPRKWALTSVVLALSLTLGGIVTMGGARVVNQAPQLRESLSKAVEEIGRKMQQYGLSPSILPGAQGSEKVTPLAVGKNLMHQLGGFIALPLEIITDSLVIVVAGIYFAARPDFYIRTVVSLIPLSRRRRALEVAHELGHALRLWLAGRFCAMVVVGVLVTTGLEVLGVKLALLLGLISGLLTFIPYLGAIVSAFPTVLVALLHGPLTALFTAIMFLLAHILEGYVLAPLIQERVLFLAPAYLILAQLLGWLTAGIFGILLATPIAVVLTVIVQMTYLEDVLGEKIRILGEHS